MSALPVDLCFCEGALTTKIRRWVCGGCLLLGAIACHPKPAVVVLPPPAVPPAAPPPPPPPPRCEALWENCSATEATALFIGQQGAVLTPPLGWKYAKQADRSLAVGSEGKALLTAVEIASNEMPAILEAIEKLATASAIEKVNFDALKKRLKSPQITVDGQDIKVDLWEIGKSTESRSNPELKDAGSGTLLVFVARLSDSRVITGLGFVVLPDAEADAEKVMNAVRSLKGKP